MTFPPNMAGALRSGAVLALAIGMLTPPIAAAEDNPTMENVLAVWRQREAATRSICVEFKRVYVTGAITYAIDGEKALRPSHDITSNENCSIVLDGIKMRYEYSGQPWASTLGKQVPEVMAAVFDGEMQKIIHRRERNDDLLHSVGYVRKRNQHPDVHNMYLSPILRHIRPLSPAFDVIKLNRLAPVLPKDVIDGIPCVVLEEREQGATRSRKYWVAPSRDMGIIRYVAYSAGEMEYQLDVVFKKDAKAGWMPHRWSGVHLNNRMELISSGVCDVLRYEANCVIPARSFELEFPPGTEVFDRASKTIYVVKKDHSIRKVMPAEDGAKYSSIMATEPGLAKLKEDKESGVMLLILVTTIGAVMAIAITVGVRAKVWSNVIRS